MHCLSITYKKAPLKFRERLSFTLENKTQVEKHILSKGVKGCIIISTCNRTELYYSGQVSAIDEIENIIAKEKKISLCDLKRYIDIYSDDKAIRHLSYVVCGMDSMVVGEGEILRQVKEAYLKSLDSQTSNDELNIIFQGAISSAKAVRTITKISTTATSIGTLTASEVIKFINDKKSGNVLILGATGKMGNILVKNLYSKKNIKLIGTRREAFVQSNNNKGIQWILHDRRYEYIPWADVVISATISPHYVLTREMVEKVLQENKSPKLFIDLAVPCDIDKDIKNLNNISMMDIDDFQYLSKENNHLKLKEMEKARLIIEDRIEEIRKAIYYNELSKDIIKIEKFIKKKGFPNVLYKLRKILTADEILRLLNCLKLMIKEES